MPRQTARHRVNAETHLDAARAQLLGDFRHRILRLRHRHAVAGGDDHRRRVAQHFCRLFRGDFAVLAHLVALAGGGAVGAEATGNHADKRAVHRLTHNVREDSARRPHQRAGDDQQIVAQHKACRRGRPAGIGVQHGDDHRHIRAADRRHQMPAERQRDNRHHEQRKALHAGALCLHENQQQNERDHQRRQVQFVTVRQHQRFRRDLAAQFAKRHHRAGKGHRADEDAEEHFGQMDIDQHRRETRLVVQVAVKAHQHRREAHEAVQNRHQLRHFGHFNAFSKANTDSPADRHRDDYPAHIAGVWPENSGDQRDRHPRDAEQVALP
ncbi:hypothetical protein BN136_395 [Cronobacter universalis NCTC 9529]|nr:hypothetical protein BN136_395 [Cronobacter universalis NCTC 9529]